MQAIIDIYPIDEMTPLFETCALKISITIDDSVKSSHVNFPSLINDVHVDGRDVSSFFPLH